MPMYDTQQILAAGIQPSKKILKNSNAIDQYGNQITPNLLRYNLDYDSILKIMSVQNRVETLERYMWVNIPPGLTQDLIERVLFYRGKGVLYYNDKIDKFQFLPFALNGVIDEYGRFTRCNTLPFTGVDDDENYSSDIKGKKKGKKPSYIYEDLELVYDLPYNKDMLQAIKDKKTVGIILNDNSLGISQEPVIRNLYVRPVLRMLATLMQIINTAMFGAADHSLLQVENESEYHSVKQEIAAINQDILRGNRFTPVNSMGTITPIKTSNTADLEGLFGTFNSLTNFLKSITGVANAGVFDKKAHLLQEEQKLNGSNSDDIYYNGLRQRQEFCLLIQAYYGYPIWCESKRGMSEEQAEDLQLGENMDTDNTQYNTPTGGNSNGSTGTGN